MFDLQSAGNWEIQILPPDTNSRLPHMGPQGVKHSRGLVMEPCTAPDREMHNDDHALHVKEVEAQNTRFVLIRNGMNAFVENESVIGPVVVESLAVQSEC